MFKAKCSLPQCHQSSPFVFCWGNRPGSVQLVRFEEVSRNLSLLSRLFQVSSSYRLDLQLLPPSDTPENLGRAECEASGSDATAHGRLMLLSRQVGQYKYLPRCEGKCVVYEVESTNADGKGGLRHHIRRRRQKMARKVLSPDGSAEISEFWI